MVIQGCFFGCGPGLALGPAPDFAIVVINVAIIALKPQHSAGTGKNLDKRDEYECTIHAPNAWNSAAAAP